MNKSIYILIFCIIFINSSICAAMKSIKVEQAAIGGIAVNSSAEYIKSIYGDPNKMRSSVIKNSTDNQSIQAETWYYGDTFQIDLVDGVAVSVVSSGNNGLATPDGITVGMKKRNMTSKYGKPSQLDKYDKRAIYTYKINDKLQMIFITRDNIIVEMRMIHKSNEDQ
ncbi:MAG: hypothetical protein IJ563_01515 [Selenomonadaceae bacterium]|nr:hypothetical protein [Selenomonadaceae bacterium]MBR1857944.1 hypothetical protein [Selenomonadaceae bacterium]